MHRIALLSFCFIPLAGAVNGAVMLQPVSASTLMDSSAGTTPALTIDQSGLSSGYVSMITDLDTYIAGNPTHASDIAFQSWVSGAGNTLGSFDFDLGMTVPIESLVLWNQGGVRADNVQSFILRFYSDPDFSTQIYVDGVFGANVNTGPSNAVLPEVFTLETPVTARYVRMDITGNWGSQSFTSIGEVAFGVTVPEPGTASLLMLAGVVSTARHRRRVPSRPEVV